MPLMVGDRLQALPSDLPVPEDDGGAAHLPGRVLPGVRLFSTQGGARGCTPEVCSIRDSIAAFTQRGVAVAGLSAQPPEDQREAAERLHLPYPLLSDAEGELAAALELPTFDWRGRRLLRRVTLLLRDGAIADVIYPVFPPDGAAAAALARLGSWP